jgi:hypothetical protein
MVFLNCRDGGVGLITSFFSAAFLILILVLLRNPQFLAMLAISADFSLDSGVAHLSHRVFQYFSCTSGGFGNPASIRTPRLYLLFIRAYVTSAPMYFSLKRLASPTTFYSS